MLAHRRGSLSFSGRPLAPAENPFGVSPQTRRRPDVRLTDSSYRSEEVSESPFTGKRAASGEGKEDDNDRLAEDRRAAGNL